MTTKTINILEDIYDKLDGMKTRDIKSFSDVIRYIIEENQTLKIDNEELRKPKITQNKIVDYE